jgi:hypothetical protein
MSATIDVSGVGSDRGPLKGARVDKTDFLVIFHDFSSISCKNSVIRHFRSYMYVSRRVSRVTVEFQPNRMINSERREFSDLWAWPTTPTGSDVIRLLYVGILMLLQNFIDVTR